jgi:hypothetical protein
VGLVVLGVDQGLAGLMVTQAFDCPPGQVPDTELRMAARVCADCLEASGVGFPFGTLPGPIPVIRPRP